jgi:hypothetical protein
VFDQSLSSVFGKGTASQFVEKIELPLILGGAAVHRCDNWSILNVGSGRCGQTAARKHFFRSLFSRPLRANKEKGFSP